MKVCAKCKEKRPLSDFNAKGARVQPYCRPCDRARSKEYYEKNKDRQKVQIRAASDRRKIALRSFVEQLKKEPCSDCGVSYPPYVMDFDHARGTKEFSISVAVNRDVVSLDRLKAEIAKCDLVCANCHRERTHARRVAGIPS